MDDEVEVPAEDANKTIPEGGEGGGDMNQSKVSMSKKNGGGGGGGGQMIDPLQMEFLLPLPEEIYVEKISRISDVKAIWRDGIKQIENMFSDHVQKINDIFDDKAMEYEKIREQLIINHDWLRRHYLEMQKKLNDRYDLIGLEREQWEKDKSEIAGMVDLESEVIPLNVGGTHHLMTERDVLRLVQGSTLEKMFNGLHELKKIDNEVFLDRDGRTF